jgi:hypothetical protein
MKYNDEIGCELIIFDAKSKIISHQSLNCFVKKILQFFYKLKRIYLTPALNQLHILSLPLFPNFIPLCIFLIYDVFFNKAL